MQICSGIFPGSQEEEIFMEIFVDKRQEFGLWIRRRKSKRDMKTNIAAIAIIISGIIRLSDIGAWA